MSRHLVLAMLVATVPAMAFAILAVTHAATSCIQAEAEDRLRTRADLLAAKVNDWADETTHDLCFTARHPDLISMDAGRHQALLQTLLSEYPQITYAHTIGVDGQNIARGDNLPLMNYSDRQYFRSVMRGAQVVHETVFRSRSTGRPALNHAAPIVSPAGKRLGVLVFGIDLQHLAHVTGATSRGRTGYSCLIDDQGRVLAQPGATEALGEKVGRLPPVSQILKDHARRSSRFRDESGAWWIAHAVPATNEWSVITLQKESEVLADARRLQMHSVIILAVSALGMMLLTWGLAARILRPVSRITEAARNITAGDWTQRLCESRNDELGTLAETFNMMLDHLERMYRSVEAQVSERTRDFEEAQALAHVGSWDWDLSAGTIRWSKEHFRIFGLDPESMPIQTDLAIAMIHPEDRGRVEAAIAHTISSGQPYSLIARIVRPDGSTRVVQSCGDAKRNPSGKVVRLLGTMSDITERTQADQKLLDSEARFHELADAMPQIVWMTDAEGNPTYLNRRFHEYFGVHEGRRFNAEELIRTTVHPDEYEPTLKAWKAAVIDGREYEVQVRLRAVNGKFRWHLIRGVAISRPSGQTDCWFGTCTDVHDQRAAAEELGERARQNAMVAAIGKALTTEHRPAEELQRCCQALVDHLDAAVARIWILNPNEEVLELAASAGLYTHLDRLHARLGLGQFKIGQIVETRTPHISNCVMEDAQFAEQDWARREGITAFAGFPLLIDDRIVGVVAVFAREVLSELSVSAIGSISDQIAVGIYRRQTEEALRLKTMLLEAQSENSIDGILAVDGAGKIILANHRFSDMWGISPELMACRDDGRLQQVALNQLKDPAAFQQTLMSLYRSESQECRDEIELKDGRVFDRYSAPLKGTDEQIYGRIFYFRDITRRRLVEQALRERMHLSLLPAAIGDALTRKAELFEMLQASAQALVTHLDAAFARIWTVDETGEFLELRASAGIYTHRNGPHSRIRVGDFKIGRIAQSQLPHLTNNVVGDPEVADQEWARRQGMVAFAGYPLVCGNRLVGVMALFARHSLTDETMDALATIADGLALGIERKHGEEELRRKEEHIRLLLNSTAEAIYGVNERGECTFANPTCVRLLGYGSVSDLLGRNMQELVHPAREDATCPALTIPIERVAEHGHGRHPTNVVLRRADGTTFPAEYWSHPITLGGLVVGSVMTFFDVTEQRTAENRLRARMAAIEAIDDEIVITDRDGIIHYVNPSFTRTTGYTADEVVGRTPACLKSGCHDAAFYEQLWKTVCEGEVWRGEVINRRKDGQLFTEEMTITPVRDEDGEVVRFVAIKRDITQRRLTEQIEQERNSLRQAVTSLERVLGVVGHELRTPLAGIRAMAEILLTDNCKQMNDEHQFLQAIEEEVIRMSGIINDLLEVARVNSGAARWNWESFRLTDPCDEAMRVIDPLVDHEHIELSWSVHPPELEMRGDPAAIRRLVLNLLTNAQKHTVAGKIEVDVQQMMMGEEAWVEVRVRDTGSGIPREIAEKVGEAFALNAGVIGDDSIRGSGLGLAICKGIVAAHGGSMKLKSRSGAGTTVTVQLRADLPEPSDSTRHLEIVRSVE